MKRKLKLTVHKKPLADARRYSHKTRKFISQEFEELFGAETESQMSEPQMAAERLLNLLKSAIPVKICHDKQLLMTYVARKYA